MCSGMAAPTQSPNDAVPKSQDEELQQIKAKYVGECKIIADVGDFKNVVILRPKEVDITIKFQLLGSYPAEKPGVIIRSDSIAIDCMPEITDLVGAITAKNQGSPVIDQLVQSVLKHIKDLGLDTPPEQKHTDNKKAKGKYKSKKSKVNHKKHTEEQEVDEKKLSMKTADDVIKRIQWDDGLPTESFLVGYLDRFLGVMEKGFTAFSWEDLASADYNVLAIPKHRIQHFKYKDVTIWDKNKRLDMMFGSVGKGITIVDVMDNYDLYRSVEMERKKVAPTAAKGKKKGTKAGCGNDDDEDSDDDIEIDLGPQSQQDSFIVDLCEDNQDSSHWQNKLRPNHFLCIRVTDREVVEGIEAVQDVILEKETRYATCCIRPATLHITLCTLGLDTVEQIANACKVLIDHKSQISEMAKQKISVRIDQIDNFYDRVLYAKVHPNNDFWDFVNYVKVLLAEAGVDIRDNYGYVPHLTIMKTSRDVSREMKTKKINRNLYEDMNDMHFGQQTVDALYLCEMSDNRREDGFYVTLESLDLIADQ